MSDWIKWNGGQCPVDGAQFVDVKLRSLDEHPHELAKGYSWKHYGNDGDIIAYRLAEPASGPAERFDAVVDLVNAPPHYKQGAIECIDAIRSALTAEEFRGHCKANAIKYIWRSNHKGGDESIRKAIWYLTEMLK